LFGRQKSRLFQGVKEEVGLDRAWIFRGLRERRRKTNKEIIRREWKERD
jgi:hypothetical protein